MTGYLHDVKTGKFFETDEYQQRAYLHLYLNPRSCLFLGMGLAKTVITLSYLDQALNEGKFNRVLIIAPDKVARITWKEEAEKWEHLQNLKIRTIVGTGEQREKQASSFAEVYTVGVSNLVWLIEHYKYKLPYDCVVIDELSMFKNRGSKRFLELRKAIKDVPYRHGLTGTPSPNSPLDLWAQMLLIDGGASLFPAFGQFTDRYFNVIQKSMRKEYSVKTGANVEIAKRIKNVALSMQTLDYVKLPDMIIKDVNVSLSKANQQRYEYLQEQYVLELLSGESITVTTAGALINKLMQVAGGAVYDEERNVLHVHDQKTGELVKIVKSNPRENFVIVYGFQHERDRIIQALPFAVELPKGDKVTETVQRWNAGNIRALVIHPASAGHGLNLQFGGSSMIWYSLTWSLELWQQTIFRLLRRGQKNSVNVYRIITRNTVDERVKQRIKFKQSNQKFLLDAVEKLRQEVQKNRL